MCCCCCAAAAASAAAVAADGCCPLLEVLHLAANQLSDESAAVLAKFNYLSVLDISSNKFAAEETIDLLQQIQTLKVLYIHRNPLVSCLLLCFKQTNKALGFMRVY